MSADDIAKAAADGPMTPHRLSKVRRLCKQYRVPFEDVQPLIQQKLEEQALAWSKVGKLS